METNIYIDDDWLILIDIDWLMIDDWLFVKGNDFSTTSINKIVIFAQMPVSKIYKVLVAGPPQCGKTSLLETVISGSPGKVFNLY